MCDILTKFVRWLFPQPPRPINRIVFPKPVLKSKLTKYHFILGMSLADYCRKAKKEKLNDPTIIDDLFQLGCSKAKVQSTLRYLRSRGEIQ